MPRAMRLLNAAAVCLLAVASACGPTVITQRVAVGAKAKLEVSAPCRLVSAVPAGVVTLETWHDGSQVYTAKAAGSARLSCQREALRLEVLAPARLRVQVPARLKVGERAVAQVVAYDASGRELVIGSYAGLDFSAAGGLVIDNPRSCEFPPWCGSPPPGGAWVKATTAGRARVEARFGGLTAAADVDVGR